MRQHVPAFLQNNSNYPTELRPCVTLFCQLSYTVKDANEIPALLNEYIPAVQTCLANYGGAILEFTTDDKGHVIYAPFGAPVAYKDDITRACFSALAIKALHKDFPDINVRLAVHQGILRTGLIGSEQRRSYAITGQATNATAAMMMQADANSILISDAVAKKLPKDFHYQTAGTLILKDGSQLDTYTLEAVNERSSFDDEVMVGREAELTRLSQYLQQNRQKKQSLLEVFQQERQEAQDREEKQENQTKAAQPNNNESNQGIQYSAAQIVAEAGLGKSLLLRQLMQKHLDIPFYVAEAEPQQAQTAYYIWRFALRNLLHIQDDTPEAVQKHLEHILPESLHERLALLAPVIAIALPESSFSKNLDPRTRQQATSALIVEILEFIAQQGFYVLALEDGHWFDDLSLQVVHTVVKRKSFDFALVVVSRQAVFEVHEAINTLSTNSTGNDTTIDRNTREDTKHDNSNREASNSDNGILSLMLTTLDDAQARVLVERRLVGAQKPREELLETILEKAEGNPFYLEELVHYIKQQQNIETIQEIPTTLHSLVLSRFDSLPNVEKDVLRAASVVGRYFNSEHLQQWYPQFNTMAHWDDKLHTLLRLSFVLKASSRQHGLDCNYFFKHILNQEIIYESLSFKLKEELHETYADFVAEHFENELDLLAYHYQRSANKQKAMSFLQKAGDFSKYHASDSVALQHYEALLELQLKQPDVDIENIVDTKLGIAICSADIPERAESAYQALFAYIDSNLQGDTKLYHQAKATGKYAVLITKKGNGALAIELIKEALALHEIVNLNGTVDNADDILETKETLVQGYLLMQEWDKAKPCIEELLIEAEAQHNTKMLVCAKLHHTEWKATMLGWENLNLEDFYILADEATKIQDSYILCDIYEIIGYALAVQKYPTEVFVHWFEKAIDFSQKLGSIFGTGIMHMNLAIMYRENQHYQEGIDYALQALSYIPKDNLLYQSMLYADISHTALLAGDQYHFVWSLSKARELYINLDFPPLNFKIQLLTLCQRLQHNNLSDVQQNYRHIITEFSEYLTATKKRLCKAIVLYLMVHTWKIEHRFRSNKEVYHVLQLLGYVQARLKENSRCFLNGEDNDEQIYLHYYNESIATYHQHVASDVFSQGLEEGKHLSEAQIKAWVFNVDSLDA